MKHPAAVWMVENKYLVLLIISLVTALYYAMRGRIAKAFKRLVNRIKRVLFTYGIWFPSYIGSIKPPPGCKLYEYNKATGIVKLAKFQEKRRVKGGKVVITKRKHLYDVAINEKNAYRKFAMILKKEQLMRLFRKAKK